MACWKALPVLIAVICIGTDVTDALVIPYDVNISNVTLNSCSVRFTKSEDAVSCETKVQAKFLSTDTVTINSTVNDVLVSGLKSNIRYEVMVRCFADNGSASAYSSPVELRTYPNGSTVIVSSPLPRVFTAFLDPIPGATEWKLQIIHVNTSAENPYTLDKPYMIFRNAIPDTTYSLRARISRVNGTLLDETASPYGAAVTATTAKLSLFGRVVLRTQLYDSGLGNRSSEKYVTTSRLWEKSLFEQYSSTQSRTVQVKILEFEIDTSVPGTIAHHEILVSGTALPDDSLFTVKNLSLYSDLKITADVDPAYQYGMYKLANSWEFSCSVENENEDPCKGSDRRIFLLNRHDGSTKVFDFTDTENPEKIAATAEVFRIGNEIKAGRTYNLSENSMYGIDQSYLFKTSEAGDATSIMYSHRYGSYADYTTDGLNETLTYSTGPEKIQTDAITYRVSKDLVAITIQMPPIYRAHAYTFSIDGSQNIQLTDLDSSAAIEATFGGLDPSRDYCINISVTINHPNGTQASSPTNCFEFHSGSPNSTSCRIVGVTPGHFRVTFDKIRFSTSYIVEISNATYARNYTTEALDYLVTEDLAPRAVYSVQVATKNPFGVGMFSAAKLTKFWSFTDITNSSITLKWDSETEDISYVVGIDKINKLIPIDSTDAVISELEAGITYNINVTAIQSDGSVFLFTDHQITVPPMPNIRLQNKSEHSLSIFWDYYVGVDYHLVNITGRGLDTSSLSYSAATSASYLDLMSGARYAVTISFHNTAGSSQTTQEFVTDFAIPSNITLVPTTNNSLSLAWSDIKGANSFLLTARSLENSSWVTNVTTTSAHANLNDLAPGTNYSINLVAVYDEGKSESSKTFYQVTVPASPTNLTMQGNSKNSIEIVWELVKGTEFYAVKIEGLGPVQETSVTTKNLSNLQPNTGYNIEVVAHNTAGSSLGLVKRFFTEFLVPGNITVSEIKSYGFVLNWTGSADADRYEIEINPPGTEINSTNITSFEITDLQPFANYTVSIRASYAEGTSDWTETIRVVTAPAPPTNLTMTGNSQNSITVSWIESNGAENYTVSVQGLSTVYETRKTVQRTTVQFLDLRPNTGYNVQVVARGRTGSSLGIAKDFFTEFLTPGNITVSAVKSDSFLLNWTGNADAIRYEIAIGSPTGTKNNFANIRSFAITDLQPFANYTVRIRASYEEGKSDWSETIHIVTAPAPPTNLTMTRNSKTSIIVSWTKSKGAGNYTITIEGLSTTHKTPGTTVQLPGLRPNTGYNVQVVAHGISGSSSEIVERFFTEFLTPGNITFSEVKSNSFLLDWIGSADAREFEIRVGSSTNFTNITGFEITGLQPFTNYSVSIRANYTEGNSHWSENIFIVTAPAPPTDLTMTRNSKTSITVSWIESKGAENYTVRVQGLSIVNETFLTTAQLLDLLPNTGYYVQVVANGIFGSSLRIAKRFFTEFLTPGIFTVSAIKSDSFLLNWTGSDDVREFEIRVGSLGLTFTNTTNTTAYQIIGLQAFTNYSVSIRAKYEEGQSNWARTIHVVTGVAAPADLYISSTTSNSVNVAWTAVAGAEFYVFDIDGNEFNTTNTVASFSNLTSGTKYLVRVRAYNSAGPSNYAQINVETIPSPPHGLVITNSTDTSVSASWNTSQGADEYFVFVSTANGNHVSGLDGTGSTTGTSVTISGLNPTTGYLIKVSARSAAGNSTYSASMRIDAAPVPPNGVTLISRTSESLKITWHEVMNVSKYDVSVYEYYTMTSDTSVEIPDLEAGTAYPVSIVSVSNGGRRSRQLSVHFQTLPNSPSLMIVSSLPTSMVLEWQMQKGAEKYNITIVPKSTGSVLTDVSTSRNFTTFRNLTVGTQYMINATSTYGGDHSFPPSTIIGFTLCLPPSGIQVISVTQTYVVLTWNSSPGADHYDIVVQSGSRKRRSSNGDPQVTANSKGGKVENLAAGMSYTLKVVAENTAGRSESGAIKIKTGLRNPATLLLVNVTTTSVTLKWDGQKDATNYRFSYAEISKLTDLVNHATADTLTPGSSYVFSIQTLSVTQPGSKILQNTYMVPNITVMTVPVPPKDLKVEKIGDQLLVTWKKTNGASIYFVHMEAGSTPIPLNTTDLNITVAMASYTKFSFTVSAMNAQNRMSAQSDTVRYPVDDNTAGGIDKIPWWIILIVCAVLVVIIVALLAWWRLRRPSPGQTGYYNVRNPDRTMNEDEVPTDNMRMEVMNEGHVGPQAPSLHSESPQNSDDRDSIPSTTPPPSINLEQPHPSSENGDGDNAAKLLNEPGGKFSTFLQESAKTNVDDDPVYAKINKSMKKKSTENEKPGTTDATQQEQQNDENNVGERGNDNDTTQPPTTDENISYKPGTIDDTQREQQNTENNIGREDKDAMTAPPTTESEQPDTPPENGDVNICDEPAGNKNNKVTISIPTKQNM